MAFTRRLLRKKEIIAYSYVEEANNLQNKGNISASIEMRKTAFKEFKSLGMKELADQQIDLAIHAAEKRALELESQGDKLNSALYFKEALSLMETSGNINPDRIANLKKKIYELSTTEKELGQEGEERKLSKIASDHARYNLASYSAEDDVEKKDLEKRKLQTEFEANNKSFFSKILTDRLIATGDKVHPAVMEGIDVPKEMIESSIKTYIKNAESELKRKEYVNSANDYLKAYELYLKINYAEKANEIFKKASETLKEGKEFYLKKGRIDELEKLYEKMLKMTSSTTQEIERQTILGEYISILKNEADYMINRGNKISAAAVLNKALKLAIEAKDESLVKEIQESIKGLGGSNI